MTVIDVPARLQQQRYLGPAWGDWLDRLPGLAREHLADWNLRLDGASMNGFCSLVLPVRTAAEVPAVLKLSMDRDTESEFEHLALRRWAGNGTVTLMRADPARRSVLLERLHSRDLTRVPDDAACEIVADLYRCIHVPALPQLRTLGSYVDGWLDDLAARTTRHQWIPRRLVEQALHRGRALTSDPASIGTLIHGDLHYENVLAADRSPWLVIDPKPMNGDPHYEPAPMLWNRWDELTGDVRGGVLRRFYALVDTAELEEERARDWVIVRVIINAHWAIEDAERMHRELTRDEREWITRCIAIAKAF